METTYRGGVLSEMDAQRNRAKRTRDWIDSYSLPQKLGEQVRNSIIAMPKQSGFSSRAKDAWNAAWSNPDFAYSDPRRDSALSNAWQSYSSGLEQQQRAASAPKPVRRAENVAGVGSINGRETMYPTAGNFDKFSTGMQAVRLNPMGINSLNDYTDAANSEAERQALLTPAAVQARINAEARVRSEALKARGKAATDAQKAEAKRASDAEKQKAAADKRRSKLMEEAGKFRDSSWDDYRKSFGRSTTDSHGNPIAEGDAKLRMRANGVWFDPGRRFQIPAVDNYGQPLTDDNGDPVQQFALTLPDRAAFEQRPEYFRALGERLRSLGYSDQDIGDVIQQSYRRAPSPSAAPAAQAAPTPMLRPQGGQLGSAPMPQPTPRPTPQPAPTPQAAPQAPQAPNFFAPPNFGPPQAQPAMQPPEVSTLPLDDNEKADLMRNAQRFTPQQLTAAKDRIIAQIRRDHPDRADLAERVFYAMWLESSRLNGSKMS